MILESSIKDHSWNPNRFKTTEFHLQLVTEAISTSFAYGQMEIRTANSGICKQKYYDNG
jgi:hypothetical protein